ncbi:helix-turn-helix domain-containing protein [Enterococcus sp. CWB-B31]|uniref:helix-turn-helix domain-containing protein n=1 Tax=Enterococcus sp. CWB-B31 TaxID=2885159 RepID=UPI001E4950E6|nr:helix-turn-helix domain-containing protein [Enterococcus sp. CWB-B31]MCB5953983.1 helix-turn-helix domain-containing protein [Enterococcus sp. CWB-B31]
MNTNIKNKEVGLRIKKIRNNLKLSMRAFGEKIDKNASGGAVGNWERGDNLPNQFRLHQIANIGNVSIAYLLYGKEFHQILNEKMAALLECENKLHELGIRLSISYIDDQSLDEHSYLSDGKKSYNYKIDSTLDTSDSKESNKKNSHISSIPKEKQGYVYELIQNRRDLIREIKDILDEMEYQN